MCYMDNLTVDQKLDLILERLDKIEKDLEQIKQQTSKMDKHVDFVDNIYVKVEAPLNYVCDKVNGMLKYDSKAIEGGHQQ